MFDPIPHQQAAVETIATLGIVLTTAFKPSCAIPTAAGWTQIAPNQKQGISLCVVATTCS